MKSRLFSVLLVACSGGDSATKDGMVDGMSETDSETTDTGTVVDTEDTDTTTTTTTEVSVAITAAEGGDVEAGEATLSIPAGALPADTTITVVDVDPSGLADAATLASANSSSVFAKVPGT